jgi:hypothetical protein
VNQERPSAARLLIEAVKAASRELRLLDEDAIRLELEAQGAWPRTGAPQTIASLVSEAQAEDPELASLLGLNQERLYHHLSCLSRGYAGILAVKDSPLQLMAETIRANSREYPRPVPAVLFEAPPFGLTPELIHTSLQAMAEAPDYADIARVETSAGGVFLYSTRFLEPAYAEFLAERLDVGLADNP